MAELGGGGGRWFTGSSADGYDCTVCHRGAPGVDLQIAGLPLDGFEPGAGYELTITWPLQTEHFALIAEVADEARQGAGTLSLPRPDTLKPSELCSGEQAGFPSSEVHEAESGRQLVSVVDCGARMLRFKWTAPATVTGPVWLDLGFVAADADATPAGDGVTMVHRPLVAARSSLGTRVIATKGCGVATPAPARAPLLSAAVWMVSFAWVSRKRRRSHSRCH